MPIKVIKKNKPEGVEGPINLLESERRKKENAELRRFADSIKNDMAAVKEKKKKDEEKLSEFINPESLNRK